MAEKIEEEKSPSSLQNLTCPLCLDIFDVATILTSCGHTFCRKCLKKYDQSHQDLDHMVCPLCRTTTKLSANRVDDLRTNVTVSGLTDDFYGKCGGVNAVLEMPPKCTACKLQCEAVSFCRTCNKYMCANCDFSHRQLTSFFEGHEIISIREFRLKVNDLIQRCATKKSELEKNIQNVEAQRHEVHNVVQKLQEDVIQAYSIKAKRLEENQRTLIEEINALKRRFDEDLDTLKSNDRQRIKRFGSLMTLVANDRLDRFERDSLSAHTLLCEELHGMLKEATDLTSAAAITMKAQKKRLMPSDDTRLHLGNIAEPEIQVMSGHVQSQPARFRPPPVPLPPQPTDAQPGPGTATGQAGQRQNYFKQGMGYLQQHNRSITKPEIQVMSSHVRSQPARFTPSLAHLPPQSTYFAQPGQGAATGQAGQPHYYSQQQNFQQQAMFYNQPNQGQKPPQGQ